MSKCERIFIVGHSGAGKGMLAQAVAKELGWQYMDADFALAPSIGRDMKEIIGDKGVEIFYHCLSEILSYQITKENIVVTTDDSIVCDEKCRKILSSEFTVYLKVSIPVQLDRISHNRPLLPSTDYKAFLDKFHRERDSFYDQASSFSINSDDGDLEEHVKKVLHAMKQ